MAVKRAKKLKKPDFDNVKVIQNRIDIAEEETVKLGNLKITLTKKALQAISGDNSKELAKEIGNIELYIDKTKDALNKFILATYEQNVALAKDLQKKYGDGTINPTKGTFIPK